MKRENLDARLLSLTPVSLDFSRCTAHTGHATSQLAFTTSGFGKFLAFATKNQEISKTQVILVLLRLSTNLLYGCATRITEPPPVLGIAELLATVTVTGFTSMPSLGPHTAA